LGEAATGPSRLRTPINVVAARLGDTPATIMKIYAIASDEPAVTAVLAESIT